MSEFPFELDEFQKEACQIIDNGESVVVCAPTGAGKTVIAQHAINNALKENVRIFYTTPLKALSNQKFYDFCEQYGQDNVGLLTGDTSINRNAQIVIMTTEVFRNMLYGTNFGAVADNLKDVRYVVLDEVHYMNDEQRGTVWEESIIYCPTNIQIIALSATVANCQELTDWINTVHSKTKLVNTDFRPVPLRFYYFDSSQPFKLLPLLTPNGQINTKIRPEKPQWSKGRDKRKKSYVKQVISNLASQDMLPAIYFTFSRKKCDEQMEKCSGLELNTKAEQQKIREFIDDFINDKLSEYNAKTLIKEISKSRENCYLGLYKLNEIERNLKICKLDEFWDWADTVTSVNPFVLQNKQLDLIISNSLDEVSEKISDTNFELLLKIIENNVLFSSIFVITPFGPTKWSCPMISLNAFGRIL